MASSYVKGHEKGYVIKIDKEFFGIASTLEEATKILNSLAKTETERLSNNGLVVFRKSEILEIQLYTHQKGIFGKTLQKELELSISEVTQLVVPSIYADKIAQYKAQKETSRRFVKRVMSSPRSRPSSSLESNFMI